MAEESYPVLWMESAVQMRYYQNMKRYSSNDEYSYALGMSLTMEALLHKSTFVEKVILSTKAISNPQSERLCKLCEENRIPVVYDEETIENRLFHSDTKIDDTFKELLDGSDITRYNVHWGGKEYIKQRILSVVRNKH